MNTVTDFTKGKILRPLVTFMIPILLAMLLQDLYGAVDLLIVGRFAQTADVSGVTTGAQIMALVMNLAINLSMGITILLGQQIGRGEREKGGSVIGAGIAFFCAVGMLLSVMMLVFAGNIATMMHAPEEAFLQTQQYLRICGGGSLVVVAFNLIGSIFRGLGDSRTPLIAVGIACVTNIIGDLILVAGFGMGAAGAAIATVAAQAVSVFLSLLIISRRQLPFTMKKRDIRWNGQIIRTIASYGLPLAVQACLVSLSFLVILAIVNHIGVVESAGMGIANKIIAFIMLMPAAFGQAMAAFVAQNAGARQYTRAKTALRYGITVSLLCGMVMSVLAFAFGENLAGLFTIDKVAAAAAHSYLKAYAIDCLLTPFLFCFIGYFNGMGRTKFVMLQGIAGAFCVRVPASFLLSKWAPVSLFKIGLATPLSTSMQIILSFWYLSRNPGRD
ncbi:MAG: MATE family efflux transporter [Lachnospiraceae bacterium]|nr:MATE family efflux transporter [Lachnospiraceae bacterium]